jgi:hypothetical protein
MASRDASHLAERLGSQALAVCRRYLSNGRRQGRYWLVGDVRNSPGRSMYVRLTGPSAGKGAAGKFTDAATGEHGDLLDVIHESCGFDRFRDTLDEARRFLSLPRPEPAFTSNAPRFPPAPVGSAETARRLFALSRPIGGTLAESYLRLRGVRALGGTASLRFHPRCYYRPDDDAPTESWPAMIAAVTGLDGRLTAVHRTWLDPRGFSEETLGKAPIETPRRALGDLLGHAVRFGMVHDAMAAGEGIETMLSLRTALPALPVAAALSAAHLPTLLLPHGLRRLYVACDRDPAGIAAATALIDRAFAEGIDAIPLSPALGDFNEDLLLLGLDALRAVLRLQLAREDVARFLEVTA